MADSSWDNGGRDAPIKSGMATWLKISLGCGIAVLVLLCTCVGGSLYLQHRIKQDPEGFKRQIKGMVQKKIQDEWIFLRRAVEQIRTDEGAKAFYAANPKLAEQYPSEAKFLEAVRGWRPELEPVPEAMPDLDSHDLQYTQRVGGGWLSYRFPSGRHVRIAWDGPKSTGDPNSHQLIEFTVR
ncbi:MAG: hypothetical protein IPQ13_00915 [Holophagaceae bacterium]|nr:hypothetical protein [Holophagaceae bacterium]